MIRFVVNDFEVAKSEYRSRGIAVLRRFLPRDTVDFLRDIIEALDRAAMRKEFEMPFSNNSPRKMSVIGGKTMNKISNIMQLYRDNALIAMLSELTNDTIVECDNLIENVIATKLHEEGDTHGWHLDDYPYALIMCLNAPKKCNGGHVELATASGADRIYMDVGDAYVLRTDKIWHRVAPISGNTIRTILNFTYASSRSRVTPNGSAEMLCA